MAYPGQYRPPPSNGAQPQFQSQPQDQQPQFQQAQPPQYEYQQQQPPLPSTANGQPEPYNADRAKPQQMLLQMLHHMPQQMLHYMPQQMRPQQQQQQMQQQQMNTHPQQQQQMHMYPQQQQMNTHPQQQQMQQQQMHTQQQQQQQQQMQQQQHPQQQQHMQLAPDFQFSTCQGVKKALYVGINYRGTRSELKGCVNDVRNIRRFLTERYNFRDHLQLTDDQADPLYQPTRANILNGMAWLVGGARAGDSLFFHFSGHGGLVRDKSGDEVSGFDSCIYPLDHERAGPIVDDEIHKRMVEFLPPGVRMTVIFDCCHSGTGMDLPYEYSADGTLKQYNPLKASLSSLKSGLTTGAARMDGIALATGLFRGISTLLSSDRARLAEAQSKQQRTSMAEVVMFSGCKDSQTSADTHIRGVGATGAMSYAFMRALGERPQQTYLSLLASVRGILEREYSQRPQLSSGYPMDMGRAFVM